MSDFYLRLPATSANLGPGFDAVALSLDLYLTIMAEPADVYTIAATGRNVDVCARLQRNLMLAVYEDAMQAAGKRAIPLALKLANDIPIGMGCGSSAAARLAGLCLANHFGELGWSSERILRQACDLEGHPDNAAACWLGGFTVASGSGARMRAVSIPPPAHWMAVLALPDEPLATSAARGVLPPTYSREDAVTNIQNVAMLTAAFQLGRGDLLRSAMVDRLHQPYREQVCPLLPLLLPLAMRDEILGVALSGAGPAVLLLVEAQNLDPAIACIQRVLSNGVSVELVPASLGGRDGRTTMNPSEASPNAWNQRRQ